ncbi:hypothetical protein SOVF_055080, partial [Spinacia oleracea]
RLQWPESKEKKTVFRSVRFFFRQKELPNQNCIQAYLTYVKIQW